MCTNPIQVISIFNVKCLVYCLEHLGHEYLSQDGLDTFNKASQKLLFGEESKLLDNNVVYTIQALSGTGALRLATDFIATIMPINKCTGEKTIVYYPSTTWANHPTIIEASHLSGSTYRYLDGSGCNLDFDGLKQDLASMVPGTVGC